MKYTMTKPCDTCPFRTDVWGYLHKSRAREIADAITRQQQSFPCHKTTVDSDDGEGDPIDTADSQHCAGALIMLEHMEQPNQMMRIAERLRLYDASKLDMQSPVFKTADKFIRHHGASRPRKELVTA